jgi:hypothetical protein
MFDDLGKRRLPRTGKTASEVERGACLRPSVISEKLKPYALEVRLAFRAFAAFFTAARASLVSILSVESAPICSHRPGGRRA